MSRDDEDRTTRGAGTAMYRRLREPALAVRVKGALGVACPKCAAPIGHRCRPLARAAGHVPGAATAKPHRERVAATR